MDIQKISDISDLINSLDTNSVSELIKFRRQLTDLFNDKINRIRTLKKNKNKKIVRPPIFISDSSDSED